MLGQLPLILLLLFVSELAPGQGILLNGASEGGVTLRICRAVNTGGAEFGPAYYRGRLVYVGPQDRGAGTLGSGEQYLQVNSADIRQGGLPASGRRMEGPMNGAFSAGPVAFTQHDRVLYFTRPSTEDGGQRGIYSAYHNGKEWLDIRPLPFSSAKADDQHPTLAPDGRRVIFASSRAGGYGGFDLYFADFMEGQWGAAINLGPEINTVGDELHPFLHANGSLYFSSNQHGSDGGFDIFSIDLSQRVWGELQRLQSPINSPGNELGFVIDKAGYSGYVASDRAGGAGQSDLYHLSLAEGFSSLQRPPGTERIVTLYDEQTSKQIDNAFVWVSPRTSAGRLPGQQVAFYLDNATGEIQTGPLPASRLNRAAAKRSNQRGQYVHPFEDGVSYRISVVAEGYSNESFDYVEDPATKAPEIGVPMQDLAETKLEPGRGGEEDPGRFIGTVLTLNDIAYPYLSANALPKDSPDLEVLYAFMKQYPSLSTLLVVHAGGTEEEATLLRLSVERAERLRRYLMQRGIPGDRLSTVGYGNRFPRRACSDCSTEDHAANTWVELKVVGWQ